MDLIPLILFTGALLFLMILGPMRKQKKEKNFLNQLKRGDRTNVFIRTTTTEMAACIGSS